MCIYKIFTLCKLNVLVLTATCDTTTFERSQWPIMCSTNKFLLTKIEAHATRLIHCRTSITSQLLGFFIIDLKPWRRHKRLFQLASCFDKLRLKENIYSEQNLRYLIHLQFRGSLRGSGPSLGLRAKLTMQSAVKQTKFTTPIFDCITWNCRTLHVILCKMYLV